MCLQIKSGVYSPSAQIWLFFNLAYHGAFLLSFGPRGLVLPLSNYQR